ncbi:MAG: hypothetical protein VB131_06500 [Burkholderia gladioli]
MKMINTTSTAVISALASMSEATAINHVFDDRIERAHGGELRYVLEVGGQRYTAFLCGQTNRIIVSPIELTDFLDEEMEVPLVSVGVFHPMPH